MTGLGWTPTSLSASWPFLKSSRVGMLEMLYLAAVRGFSSMLSLPTTYRPADSEARASRVGASRRQGPHQGAQAAARMGFGPERRMGLSKGASGRGMGGAWLAVR